MCAAQLRLQTEVGQPTTTSREMAAEMCKVLQPPISFLSSAVELPNVENPNLLSILRLGAYELKSSALQFFKSPNMHRAPSHLYIWLERPTTFDDIDNWHA